MKTILFVSFAALAAVQGFGQDYTISSLDLSPSEAAGWQWESFADGVMGGKSELTPPANIETESGKALLLAGRVITKGGGFIQVRLKYDEKSFDASGYTGVEIEVDARSRSSWYVFLRTRDNVFPWSYYAAAIEPTEKRSVIRIPFSDFKAASTLRKSVRTQLLSSVALVAAFEDFNAYMRIYRVGFYK
ncbi:MAG: CIA30 family protein [Spirochaetia bacterium]|jgi:hypothetical protein|nr:CIA30 family protein [Spirochaetia bacterium]